MLGPVRNLVMSHGNVHASHVLSLRRVVGLDSARPHLDPFAPCRFPPSRRRRELAHYEANGDGKLTRHRPFAHATTLQKEASENSTTSVPQEQRVPETAIERAVLDGTGNLTLLGQASDERPHGSLGQAQDQAAELHVAIELCLADCRR